MRLRSVVIALIATVLLARGADIECRPGRLASQLGADAATMTELRLGGSAEPADLHFIATAMPELRVLDMSALDIDVIPAGTFAGTSLTEVLLPVRSGLSIGDMAFAATPIKTLRIPDGTACVGTGAFAACPQLRTASMAPSASYGSHIFRDCRALALADLGGMDAVPDATFKGCTALASVVGCEKVRTIGTEAFAGCTALHHFGFAPATTTVAPRAFMRSGLERAQLGATAADSIGTMAFFGCDALAEATLPPCTLPDYAFVGSPLQGNLDIAEGTPSLGRYALQGTSLTGVVLPASLNDIGDGAMEAMAMLADIDARALDAVPVTGNDVWQGIDRASVNLFVKLPMAAAFGGAGQWREFNIVADPTSANAPDVAANLHAYSDGNGVLTVFTDGPDMAVLRLVGLDGKVLALANPGAPSHSMPLPAPRTFIIAATLADGAPTAILKFAR